MDPNSLEEKLNNIFKSLIILLITLLILLTCNLHTNDMLYIIIQSIPFFFFFKKKVQLIRKLIGLHSKLAKRVMTYEHYRHYHNKKI